jgi:PhnB protein
MPRAKKASSKKTHTAKKSVKKLKVKRKSKKVLAIPKGYHSITPYLIIDEAAKAIKFYKKVFGAKEVMRMDQPDGKVGHAELKIGDSIIMLADECPAKNAKSPTAFGGSAIAIHLYIKDVDTVVKRAVKLGAKLTRPVVDMFYGDRAGEIVDPFGHKWYVSTHVEDVTPAKLRKRVAELFGAAK